MRLVFPLLAPLLMASTITTPPPQESAPPRALTITPDAQPVGRNCRGRIEQAREERGLPKLQRDTATPDEPLFIAAVDKQIDGCEVLVMRNNTSDIRPLPEFSDGPAKLQRLR